MGSGCWKPESSHCSQHFTALTVTPRRLVILPMPDQGALERAGAAFARAPSRETERSLATELQAFSERAELLALYVAGVGGQPVLS